MFGFRLGYIPSTWPFENYLYRIFCRWFPVLTNTSKRPANIIYLPIHVLAPYFEILLASKLRRMLNKTRRNLWQYKNAWKWLLISRTRQSLLFTWGKQGLGITEVDKFYVVCCEMRFISQVETNYVLRCIPTTYWDANLRNATFHKFIYTKGLDGENVIYKA